MDYAHARVLLFGWVLGSFCGGSGSARGLLNVAPPRVAPISLRAVHKGVMGPGVRTGTGSHPQHRVRVVRGLRE